MTKVLIHVLLHGLPLCRFNGNQPGAWPLGHAWIRREEIEFTRVGLEKLKESGETSDEDLCEGCLAADQLMRVEEP